MKKFRIGGGGPGQTPSMKQVVPSPIADMDQLRSPIGEKRYFVNIRNRNDSNVAAIMNSGTMNAENCFGNKEKKKSNQKLPNTITEPIQQVYRVAKPGSQGQLNVKVDVVQEEEIDDNKPVVMSLKTIVNY